MLKSFNPILDNSPTVFNEDVYLFSASGKVITCREGYRDQVKDIFSLMEGDEVEYVYDNMMFFGLKPLILVDSSQGPLFIDTSLYGSYRLLIAIIPSFTREEILTICSDELSARVNPSRKMRQEIASSPRVELDGRHKTFMKRLLDIHESHYYNRSYARSNGDVAVMMSEIARSLGDFYGCRLNIFTNGMEAPEARNPLSVNSYIFALTSLIFLARNYSSGREARMDIFFNELGVYFEFGFQIAQEHRGKILTQEARELVNFAKWADMRLFVCNYYQDDRAFAARAYPWYRSPDSSDIKERRPELIYNG